MRVLNHLREEDKATGPEAPAWTDWYHHQQVLEAKPDSRAAFTAALRRRFVDHGEWKALWIYLMGLLYRSEASLDSMREVCRPLRNSTVTPWFWKVLGRRKRDQTIRAAALEESLTILEQSLASSAMPLAAIHEDALRKAAVPFIESETEHNALAVALISAHCQRGDELVQAVNRWFHLLEVPDASPGWFTLFTSQRLRPDARMADRGQRLRLVDDAIHHLFFSEPARANATLGKSGVRPRECGPFTPGAET